MRYIIFLILLTACQGTAPVLTDVKQSAITDLALASTCAEASYSGQGTAPKSFMRGIALSYAKAVCHSQDEYVKVASGSIGSASKDALAHYGYVNKSEDEALDLVYSLAIGSAARESSWRWCVGKDPGASNTSSETCEAGLYQTSFNSRSAHPVLMKLFKQYQSDKSGCYAKEYKGATTCSESNMKNWGSGDGVEFQKMSKECPGFSTDYHVVMLRTQRTHYGPINQKKAEVKSQCVNMFAEIRKLVKANPGLCSTL